MKSLIFIAMILFASTAQADCKCSVLIKKPAVVAKAVVAKAVVAKAVVVKRPQLIRRLRCR